MNTKNGGPAFPAQEINHKSGQWETVMGMSLRDYFAAKAMQSYIATAGFSCLPNDSEIANYAYASADAMLKARNDGKEPA